MSTIGVVAILELDGFWIMECDELRGEDDEVGGEICSDLSDVCGTLARPSM